MKKYPQTGRGQYSIAQFIEEYYPYYYQWHEYTSDECIPFSKVSEQWGILGNFAPTPLVVNGVEFANCEQLFQMMKFADAETLRTIHGSKGMKIKYAAKAAEKLELRRPDWGQIIVDAMKFCLQTKYDQSEQFRQALKETVGKIIVEDQTGFKKTKADTWGAKLIDGKYCGSNLLGRLLMELRDNGRLDYHLPADIFDFIKVIKGHTPSAIAVFASGSGSNAENIIRYTRSNPDCGLHVALIVCNNPKAGVIERARRLDTPVIVMTRDEINDPDIMLAILNDYNVDAIALAGFLMMIPDFLLQRYPERIINIHPSLLPKYGGKGMYGRHIHEAVVAAGETETGITIHYVSSECDGGRIIFQAAIPVAPGSTPSDVETSIHELERLHYPRVLASVLRREF